MIFHFRVAFLSGSYSQGKPYLNVVCTKPNIDTGEFSAPTLSSRATFNLADVHTITSDKIENEITITFFLSTAKLAVRHGAEWAANKLAHIIMDSINE